MNSQNQNVSGSVLAALSKASRVSHLAITQPWQGEHPNPVAGCAWPSNSPENSNISTRGSATRGQLGDFPLIFLLSFLDPFFPSTSHNCVMSNSCKEFLIPQHSEWLCFLNSALVLHGITVRHHS